MQPPAIAWKMVSQAVQEWICQNFLPSYNSIKRVDRSIFPSSWYNTYVILLPKPGKAAGTMKSLRPIGLQDPVAKATISVIAKAFRPYAHEYLRDVPQYAYLPTRDTGAAIARVIGHCRAARSLLRSQTPSIHQARAGIKPSKFTGALQVSIDLAQAFDRAPWSLLQEAVDRTASPQKLRDTIMQWIRGTMYHIQHEGQTVQVVPGTTDTRIREIYSLEGASSANPSALNPFICLLMYTNIYTYIHIYIYTYIYICIYIYISVCIHVLPMAPQRIFLLMVASQYDPTCPKPEQPV